MIDGRETNPRPGWAPTLRRANLVVLAGATALFLPGCPYVKVPDDPVPRIASFSCETACAQDRPRSSSLVLEWTNPSGEALRLQATTYKSGFERGFFKFADLTSTKPEVRSSTQTPETDAGPIGDLTLTRLEGAAYRLDVADVDPGSRYYLRLFAPADPRLSAETDCVARVCPIDYIDQQVDNR